MVSRRICWLVTFRLLLGAAGEGNPADGTVLREQGAMISPFPSIFRSLLTTPRAPRQVLTPDELTSLTPDVHTADLYLTPGPTFLLPPRDATRPDL